MNDNKKQNEIEVTRYLHEGVQPPHANGVEKDFSKIEINPLTQDILLRGADTALIETVSIRSQPQLGLMIAKNDYPVPIMYPTYDHQLASIRNKVNFDLFQDIFCVPKKHLALVTGTVNTMQKGKSHLIPFMFTGLNKESIMKTSVLPSVDVICNDETCPDWIVIDFNGSTQCPESAHLLELFSYYAFFHVIHVTLDDFDRDLKPSDEVRAIFSRYETFQNNDEKHQPASILLLIRDLNDEDQEKCTDVFKKISKEFAYLEDPIYLRVASVVPLKDIPDDDSESERRLIIEIVQQFIERRQKKYAYSLSEYTCTMLADKYKALSGGKRISDRTLFEEREKIIEDFKNNFKAYNLNELQLFPLSKINRKLNAIENKIKDEYTKAAGFDDETVKCFEKEKNKLLIEKKNMNPVSELITFFVNLLNQSSSENALKVLNRCLANMKHDNFNSFKKERFEKINERIDLTSSLKSFLNANSSLDDKAAQKVNQMKVDIDELSNRISELDELIEDWDLSVEKLWDELILIIDWNDESLEQNAFISKHKQIIINKFAEALQLGFSMHVLRGHPLQIRSKTFDLIFKGLKQKNIYVVSIIGEQSSAKSSLLNALFGCGFQTSAGRCTVGIYMNVINVEDKTIVLLDTEGLMSVEAGNIIFDNQMASMAALSSHVIIVNHKGEISSNMERLLGMIYYAKMRADKSKFKPSIMFVIRRLGMME